MYVKQLCLRKTETGLGTCNYNTRIRFASSIRKRSICHQLHDANINNTFRESSRFHSIFYGRTRAEKDAFSQRLTKCFLSLTRLPWVPEVSHSPFHDLPAKGQLMSAPVTIETSTETGNRPRQTSGTQGMTC